MSDLRLDDRIRSLGERLKVEAEAFIDYPTIEERTRALGFPTPVRTLRFYANEGVLPPPKKQGKTPVYHADWILNVLLAVHLMKTRFGRSLDEVRAILNHLTEDPAVLADKCTVLYEEFGEGSRLAPVQREWLAATFFGLLNGRGTVDGRPVAPSAVRLVDLATLAERGGDWRDNGRGGREWVPPAIDPRVYAERPASAGAGGAPGRPDRHPGKEEGDAPPSARAIPAAGAQGPEAVEARERARRLETLFGRRFEAHLERYLGRHGAVRHPGDGVARSLARGETPRETRRLARVIAAMEAQAVHERAVVDQMPVDLCVAVAFHDRGLLGRKDLRILVAASATSPLEALVTGRRAAPSGRADLERVLEDVLRGPEVFHYLGVLATAGWSDEVRAGPPCGTNYVLVLVEHVEGTRFRVIRAPDARWDGLATVFDPETEEERRQRVHAFLAGHASLALRGGHLLLAQAAEELGLEAALVEEQARVVAREGSDLEVLDVAGRRLLKRRRV